MAGDPLRGRCPACGEEGLFRGYQGVIRCSNTLCENPNAAHALLNEPELTEHLLRVLPPPWSSSNWWTLRHPLVERLHDALFDCEVAHFVTDLVTPGTEPGVYRVAGEPPYELEKVSDHAPDA